MVDRTKLDALEAQEASLVAQDAANQKTFLAAQQKAAKNLARGRGIISTNFDQGFITVKGNPGGEGGSSSPVQLKFSSQREIQDTNSGVRNPLKPGVASPGNPTGRGFFGGPHKRKALQTQIRIAQAGFNAASKARAVFENETALGNAKKLADRKAQANKEGKTRFGTRSFLQSAAAGVLEDDKATLVSKV